MNYWQRKSESEANRANETTKGQRSLLESSFQLAPLPSKLPPLNRNDDLLPLGRRSRGREFRKLEDGPQSGSLKLCLSIEVLLDGILSSDEGLHGFLEALADVVEDLSDGSGGELGESREGEEADD